MFALKLITPVSVLTLSERNIGVSCRWPWESPTPLVLSRETLTGSLLDGVCICALLFLCAWASSFVAAWLPLVAGLTGGGEVGEEVLCPPAKAGVSSDRSPSGVRGTAVAVVFSRLASLVA